tara:strand:+ start:39 stop:242 length:204 start_codon:yes stop_codon:yes gene_type:complete
MLEIQIGDLITLKGMSRLDEKPLGIVKKKWATNDIEILWLNFKIARRFAVHDILDFKKVEIISKANQ